MHTAEEVTSYPLEPLLCRRGWNTPHFALGNGKVHSPKGASKPVILYTTDDRRWAEKGTPKRWREFTSHLAGQPIATFFVITGFAGPLLELMGFITNIGFELIGPGGAGKSTIQRVAAALFGPADHPSGFNYWVTASTIMNGLEGVLADYNDAAIIIDEGTNFAAADHLVSRAAKWNELVFRLNEGSTKGRFNSDEASRSRFIFLVSANEALAQLLSGHRVSVAETAADRLITIPISPERPYGIFDQLPPGYTKSVELAEFFAAGVRTCYGVGFRKFISKLVRQRSKNEHDLVCQIKATMAEFRARTGVNCNSGSEVRAADSFVLVAAAGNLAASYGAMSRENDSMEAALAAYLLHLNTRSKQQSSLVRLLDLRDGFDVLVLKPDSLSALSDQELNEFSCIEREGRNGGVELLPITRYAGSWLPKTGEGKRKDFLEQIASQNVFTVSSFLATPLAGKQCCCGTWWERGSSAP